MKPTSSLILLSAAMSVGAQSVSELEKLAVGNHPFVLKAMADAKALRAQGEIAKSPFRPMVSATAVGAIGDDAMIFSGSVFPEPYLLAAADPVGLGAVMAMWQIYSSGQNRSAESVFHALFDRGVATVSAAKLDVTLSVRVAYARALAAKGLEDAAVAGVEAAKELLNTTEARFVAGSVPEAFLLKSRANLASAERKRAIAAAGAASSIAELKEAAAVSEVQTITLEDWQFVLAAPANLEAALLRSTERPELAAGEARRREAVARAESARRSRGPKINLVGMGNAVATEFQSDVFYKLGIVLSVPLIDGGLRSAQASESQALTEAADQDLRSIRLRIEREVVSAWAEWAAAPAVLSAGEAEVSYAQEAYRIAKLRYTEGKAPQVEVEQAVADLVSALAGRVEANAFRRVAWAKLMRAIGDNNDQEDLKKHD